MRRNNFRRLGGILCFLLIMLTSQAQQYTVTGGRGTPLLAKNDKPLQVYLVYGMDNLTISYTSSSSNHQWFRYKTKALEREPVVSEQNGTTSVIRNIAADYGYYVEEPGNNGWYVWIIDYSNYLFNPQSLSVASGDCSGVYLGGAPAIPAMKYYAPEGGSPITLQRQFEVTYQSMEWQEESKQFISKTMEQTILGDPFVRSKASLLNAPLCDTEFTLKGDQFARHFNMEKTITTEQYQAVAVEVHADTTLMMDNAPNLVAGEGGLSAPAEVHFTAYANEPVASLYIWTIYRDEDGPEKPLVRFPGAEVDYTFNVFGDFTAALEVSDRTGVCSGSASYSFKITESFLDVPNAFSPGTTPGINDEFRVAYRSIVNYKCWIFNRWGVEMYHSTNPAEGWNGKKGGKYVPPGVYFYVIEGKGSNGEKYSKKGSINILRPKTIDDEVIKQ